MCVCVRARTQAAALQMVVGIFYPSLKVLSDLMGAGKKVLQLMLCGVSPLEPRVSRMVWVSEDGLHFVSVVMYVLLCSLNDSHFTPTLCGIFMSNDPSRRKRCSCLG